MQLPAFVEFTVDVPSLDLKAGDRVWLTEYSATLTRCLELDRVRRHLDLAKPVELRVKGASS